MTTIGTVRDVWRYPFKSMGGELLQRTTLGPLGIPGDRGWALRDQTAGEIRGGKKLPALMSARALFAEPDAGAVPPVEVTLPDGARFRTDAPDAAERLSAYLGRAVTVWPLRPPDDREHYRRGMPDNPDMEQELRAVFGRTPDEPLPDLSVFPQELFEFTSPLGTYFDAFPLHVLTTAALAAMGPASGSTSGASVRTSSSRRAASGAATSRRTGAAARSASAVPSRACRCRPSAAA